MLNGGASFSFLCISFSVRILSMESDQSFLIHKRMEICETTAIISISICHAHAIPWVATCASPPFPVNIGSAHEYTQELMLYNKKQQLLIIHSLSALLLEYQACHACLSIVLCKRGASVCHPCLLQLVIRCHSH